MYEVRGISIYGHHISTDAHDNLHKLLMKGIATITLRHLQQ
jgi:hypothetical protein